MEEVSEMLRRECRSKAEGAESAVRKDSRNDKGQEAPAPVKMTARDCSGIRQLMEQEEESRREEGGAADTGTLAAARLSEYRFFHLDEMEKELKIPESVHREAARLIQTGAVRAERIEVEELGIRNMLGMEGIDDPAMIVGKVRLVGGEADYGMYPFYVELIIGQRHLLQSVCGSWKCHKGIYQDRDGYRRRLCAHEVAGILLFRNYLSEHLADATTEASRYVIQALSGQAGTELTAGQELEQQNIELEPQLEILDGGALHCSFRAGNGKLYKIRNLQEFCVKMEKQEPMFFTSKMTLKLSEQYLTGKAAGWYAFICGAVREDQHVQYLRIRDRYAGASASEKGEIELFGERLDRFLELALGCQIPVQFRQFGRREKEVLTLRNKKLMPQLTIRPVLSGQDVPGRRGTAAGELDGIRVEGKLPEIYCGIRSACWLEDGYLNRIGKSEMQALRPLLATMQEDHRISLPVGRMSLSDFYHKALPQLRRIAEVTEENSALVAEYLPPEPAFTIYLDIDNNAFLCRAEAAYGQEIFSLSDVLFLQKSSAYPQYRDRKEEEQIVQKIGIYFPNYDRELEIFYVMRDTEEAFDLLDHGLDALAQIPRCQVRMTDRFRRLGLRRNVQFDIGVSLESNLMDLSVTARELSEDEVLQVLYQYQKKRRFLVLKNGDFLRLENNESLERLTRMMEDLHIPVQEIVKGKMHLPAYRALYLDKMLEGQDNFYTDRDRHFKELIKGFKTVQDSDYEVPEHLKTVMRPYQKDGYRWLRTLDHYGFGGILADEMGLGKTLQVLAVLDAVHRENASEITELSKSPQAQPDTNVMQVPGEGAVPVTSLVICPASLVYNWLEETRRFAPSLHAVAVTGTAAARAGIIHRVSGSLKQGEPAGEERIDLLITSYDLLKRDIALYEGIRFRFEILDEAQYIKTHTTAAAKSVKLVQAVTRFALTGTPIENRLSELWSIFDFLMPGFLYAYDSFRSGMEMPIVKNEDTQAMERLHRMIAPFLLRRQKKDVLRDLPDKLEEIRYAGMEGKQQKLYDAQVIRMRNDLKQQSESDFRRSKIQILAELTRIRQICCDPSLCFTNYDGESAKTELCMELLHSLIDGGHRTLVFSQFTSMLEILQKRLDADKIPYYLITGSTSKEERMKRVKAFNEGEIPIFLISLKAGGTGLNLVGADSVIHFDPWWNTAAENQASDRAHRIGQTRAVTVYKLVAKGTIEEKIVAMQQQKAKLAEDILGGEGIGSAVLSKEDLMKILG